MMNRVHGSRQALQEITEDDEEMALMNLTLLRNKPKLYRFPLIPEIVSRHDEIEELVESYLMDFASLESKIDYVRSQIQSSEELVSALFLIPFFAILKFYFFFAFSTFLPSLSLTFFS
jgi:C4-dicarboxylate-specific signal transduction histidine kinase